MTAPDDLNGGIVRGWIRIHDGVIERDPNITPLIFTQVIEKIAQLKVRVSLDR